MPLPTAEEQMRSREKNRRKRENKRKRALAVATKASLKSESHGLSAFAHMSIEESWDNPANIIMSKAARLKEQIEKANADWPWEGVPQKLLTQAPYALNEYNAESGFFSLPEAKQTSPILSRHRAIDDQVLLILFHHHSCASKFAATCQSAFHLVSTFIDHWDVSRDQGFNNCDIDPKSPKAKNAAVGKVVHVTQFRNRIWKNENYACQMYTLQRMTLAFSNYAERFEILHLHRIPLLNTDVLELVVPLMRRLKVLGIYCCELIHLGDTEKLLNIVGSNRGAGMTKDVALDFYPRFHVGPESSSPSVYTGSYGVTWDNFYGLDSRLAIWKLVMGAVRIANSQGVDLTSKDSAFRLWLEKSPCWRVEDTLNAIKHEEDEAKLASQILYPLLKGKPLMQPKDDHVYVPDSKLKNQSWCLGKYHCYGCCENVLGIFFDMEEIATKTRPSNLNDAYVMLCLGCKLSRVLDNETDHRKQQKLNMVYEWLRKSDGEINNNDIRLALRPKMRERGITRARYYDDQRRSMVEKGKDTLDVQAPYQRIRYSPTIYDREPENSDSVW